MTMTLFHVSGRKTEPVMRSGLLLSVCHISSPRCQRLIRMHFQKSKIGGPLFVKSVPPHFTYLKTHWSDFVHSRLPFSGHKITRERTQPCFTSEGYPGITRHHGAAGRPEPCPEFCLYAATSIALLRSSNASRVLPRFAYAMPRLLYAVASFSLSSIAFV